MVKERTTRRVGCRLIRLMVGGKLGINYASVAQRSEHRSYKSGVDGSNPSRCTIGRSLAFEYRAGRESLFTRGADSLLGSESIGGKAGFVD